MNRYVLIETRSASESPEVCTFLETVRELGGSGAEVNLYLMQNGVFMAARDTEPLIADLAARPGVTVWADDFSLQMRSMGSDSLTPAVRVAGMAELVAMLAVPGCKAIWH